MGFRSSLDEVIRQLRARQESEYQEFAGSPGIPGVTRPGAQQPGVVIPGVTGAGQMPPGVTIPGMPGGMPPSSIPGNQPAHPSATAQPPQQFSPFQSFGGYGLLAQQMAGLQPQMAPGYSGGLLSPQIPDPTKIPRQAPRLPPYGK
jgi:hypothetical protein